MKKKFFLQLFIKDRCTLCLMIEKASVLEVQRVGQLSPCSEVCLPGVCSLKTTLAMREPHLSLTLLLHCRDTLGTKLGTGDCFKPHLTVS